MSRDAIARSNSISAGAVSNIIKEWKIKLGEYDAEAIRDLVIALKTTSLSLAKCAVGMRTAKMLEELGMDLENQDIEESANKKMAEIKDMDCRLDEKKLELSNLAKNKAELEWSRDSVLEKRNKVTREMDLFLEAKQELNKHNISVVQDVPRLVKTVKTISELGYDPKRVLDEFEDLRYH